jgi:FAD/FMN-containing dehydrogenase
MAIKVSALKEQLAAIVGKDSVLDSPDAIERYGRDHSIERPGLFSCVVRPGTVDETQKIVQLANNLKFAIVPQTSGIHFNGAAVPKEGGVVLDLSRMNRIVDIVDDSMVAHLQVGVTWEQFQTALEAKGYRSIIPLLPYASRSVIMDWLEKEPPVLQNYECAGALRSMQIIYGNGELLVTGSASIGSFRNPGVLADGVVPAGPGPMSYDTFLYGAQGTIGVVTWGVVTFEPMPTLTKTFFIPADRLGDVIEPVYRILRRGVCNECLLLNNINLATILAENWPEQFVELRKLLPPWTVIFISSALKRRPEEKIAYQEEFLRDMMSSYFSKLQLLTTLPGLPAVEKRLPEMLRKPWPKDKTYWKHANKGGCQDLTFMTTLDRVERYVPLVAEVAARHGYLVNDIGCYIQPVEDGHACQIQFNFYYDFSDEAEKEKIRGLYAEAAAAAFDMGAYFTRPYHMVAKMVYRENGDYASLLKRLKKQFDPNGVLSPGNICF